MPHKVLELLPFDISSVIEEELSSVTLTHKLKNGFTRSYAKPLICTVDREKFDDFLVRKSQGQGVNFLDDQKITSLNFNNNIWTVTTPDRIIKADVLVGADGANSYVAKHLSLRSCDILHVGLQVEVPKNIIHKEGYSNNSIAIDWGMFEDSYAWIFPKKDLVSIGVKGPLKSGKQLKSYLQDVLENYGVKMEDQNLSGHVIPHRIGHCPIYAERALLVGDAAGQVDYWTGEGISYSIKSARIAAEQIKRFLDGQQKSLAEYEKAIDDDLSPNIKTSYQFSKIFNYLSPLAFKMIRKYDYPWDIFCRAMRGDRTFFEVKKRFRPDILFKKLILKSQRRKE